MPQNSDSIVIAGSGSVHVALLGTALPTDVSTALAAAFVDLGYINGEGASFKDAKTKEPVPVWQSFYAVKYTVTDASASLAFTLRQWDRYTVPLAFGGGAIAETSVGSGVFRYEPPAPEVIDERALVLTWRADESTFRLVVPRVMVTEGVDTKLVRTAPSDLPITVGVLGTDGVKPWALLTDHPSFDPTP